MGLHDPAQHLHHALPPPGPRARARRGPGAGVRGRRRGAHRGAAEPEAATSQLHLREEIDAALQRLPPDYRMAVVLADIEGLSYKEIAEAMECPIGTVMSRIHRGRRQLHSLLYRHAVDAGLAEEPEAPVSLDAYRNRAASARS
ncbi:sigma-70 family RNA polymerase sigma factor [Nannocystis pusilla]|uniref:sigma-70 family RNA polymerase sigma factor n=1 Tax=Nannocystis pusilla TaxID=889268 RepID=UPI0030B7F593